MACRCSPHRVGFSGKMGSSTTSGCLPPSRAARLGRHGLTVIKVTGGRSSTVSTLSTWSGSSDCLLSGGALGIQMTSSPIGRCRLSVPTRCVRPEEGRPGALGVKLTTIASFSVVSAVTSASTFSSVSGSTRAAATFTVTGTPTGARPFGRVLGTAGATATGGETEAPWAPAV